MGLAKTWLWQARPSQEPGLQKCEPRLQWLLLGRTGLRAQCSVHTRSKGLTIQTRRLHTSAYFTLVTYFDEITCGCPPKSAGRVLERATASVGLQLNSFRHLVQAMTVP